MALLQRIVTIPTGRRAKWAVVAVWIALLAVGGSMAGKLSDVQQNNSQAWLPGSAQSTKVADLSKRFPDADTSDAAVVYSRADGGRITAADRAAVARDRGEFTKLAKNDKVGPAVASRDGKALLLTVPLYDASVNKGGKDTISPAVKDIRRIADSGTPAGLQARVAGPAGQSADFADAFEGLDGTLLMVASVVVILLLLAIYRSPTLWLAPLITVGVAVSVAMAVVYLLAKNAGLVVNGQSQGILTVLVFGATTDYALLLISRYREELHRHSDRHEAMAVALRRAGPALVASAATVTLGVLCLLVADLNSNSSLGPVAAVGVVCALLTSMTLLPALLVATGRWMFWPFVPRAGTDPHSGEGIWGRVAGAIGRGPRTAWIGGVVVLGVLAIGLTSANTGLSQADSFTSKPESVVGQQIIAAHYPAGRAAPAQIIGDASAQRNLIDAVRDTRGVSAITGSEHSRDGRLVQLQATLTSAPDSDAAQATVERLRDSVASVPAAHAAVGGESAVLLDVGNAWDHDERTVIPLVLIVVALVLMVLLRALVAPLMLIGTVVLSYAASLGLSTVLFDQLLGYPALDNIIPLFGFIFLVALGVDYNIFLMTRVREEVQQRGNREGVLHGLRTTGGVITSAGIVLAATFAALATMPLTALTELGMLVAIGVLIDTLIVRTVVVPALAIDIGRATWWPSALARGRRPRRDDDDGHDRPQKLRRRPVPISDTE